jgi:hypothetical protein
MRELRQSTSVDLPIGPFVDATDGVTAETALTLTQPDIRLKKNAAAWAQKNAAQTLSHEENGWYEVTLDATDTGTLGQLMLAVHESGALPVFHEFSVITAEAWDAKYAGTGVGMRADVRGWLGTTPATPGTAGIPSVDVVRISGDDVAADDLELFIEGTAISPLPQVNAAQVAGSTPQTVADIKASTVEALATDTYAEPSAPPAATASLKDKIGFMTALARNKHNVTATNDVLRNDADSATIATAPLSDDGTTMVRGEFA